MITLCTSLNRITGNRISYLVDSRTLTGMESFAIPTLLKCDTQVNQLLNKIKLLWYKSDSTKQTILSQSLQIIGEPVGSEKGA